MPELPEVETVRRSLQATLVGRTITAVREINWLRTIATPAPDVFCERICGQQVAAVERRAKYILIKLSAADTLVVHLRMTGQLLVVDRAEPTTKHTHVVLSLDDGRELRFDDTRKFGRWSLLSPPELAELDAKLGAEPLAPGWSVAALQERLQGRRTRLKPLLLDQAFVAGIGNIYADEALWHAQLHPLRTADTLGDAEVAALHAGIVQALTQGVERRGTTLQNYRDAEGQQGENQHYLQAYGRTGQPCTRCGSSIERIIVGQRSTHICPACQLLT